MKKKPLFKRLQFITKGTLKGKILSQAELPRDLESLVSTHLGWSVPQRITKRKKIRSIVQPTIEENDQDVTKKDDDDDPQVNNDCL